MTAEGGRLKLDFTSADRPGAYLFGLTGLRPTSVAGGQPVETPDYRAVAVNVDAAREGDLRRGGRDDVLSAAPGAMLHSPDDPDWLEGLKNKKTDWSEAGLLFLALLLLLMVEQAMAVRLSYHAAVNEVATTAPSAATALRRPAPPVDADPVVG